MLHQADALTCGDTTDWVVSAPTDKVLSDGYGVGAR